MASLFQHVIVLVFFLASVKCLFLFLPKAWFRMDLYALMSAIKESMSARTWIDFDHLFNIIYYLDNIWRLGITSPPQSTCEQKECQWCDCRQQYGDSHGDSRLIFISFYSVRLFSCCLTEAWVPVSTSTKFLSMVTLLIIGRQRTFISAFVLVSRSSWSLHRHSSRIRNCIGSNFHECTQAYFRLSFYGACFISHHHSIIPCVVTSHVRLGNESICSFRICSYPVVNCRSFRGESF